MGNLNRLKYLVVCCSCYSTSMRSARLAALSMCGASALLVWQTVLLSLQGGYMRMGSASVHASAVPAFDATR